MNTPVDVNHILRQLPKIDVLLEALEARGLSPKLDSLWVKRSAEAVLDSLRADILKRRDAAEVPLGFEAILDRIEVTIQQLLTPGLRRVINGTGIVLHTNLGRAVIGPETFERIKDIMTHYNTLEYDVDVGGRGSRYSHVERHICALTGAEAALVVNNNAAAVMLVLNTLASDREVVISRGELIEIGGSFRIPDVMRASGCHLREIGTTNRTHLKDYETAITEETALLLKVHTSNYKVLGFTHMPELEALAALAHAKEIPVYEDLGSGAFLDFSTFGLEAEATVRERLEKGADVVSFSGDKLLGGSQAGIIAGKKILIDRMKQNQLLRALRVDKLTLAVLEDTFIQYYASETAREQLPTLRCLAYTPEAVLDTVTEFIKRYAHRLDALHVRYVIEPMTTEVGGGAMPTKAVDSYGICLYGISDLQAFQHALRHQEIPVIGTISKEALRFDFRTLFDDDFEHLMRGLEGASADIWGKHV